MEDKTKDLAYAMGKGVVGSSPIGGAFLSEIFGFLVADPAVKRRDDFANQLDDRLKNIEEDGVNIQALRDDEEFLSVVMHVMNISLRTHQEIKRQALLNAVYNTGKGISIEENLKLMFLSYIDSFGEWHIKVLRYLENPTVYVEKNSGWGGSKEDVLLIAFPELRNNEDFYEQIIKDLYNRGLSKHSSLGGMVSDAYVSCTSEHGEKFLRFIEDSN